MGGFLFLKNVSYEIKEYHEDRTAEGKIALKECHTLRLILLNTLAFLTKCERYILYN